MHFVRLNCHIVIGSVDFDLAFDVLLRGTHRGGQDAILR